jgi:hypothetical protein
MGIRQEAAFGLRIDTCSREKRTEFGTLFAGEGQVLLSFFSSLLTLLRIVPPETG